MYEIKTARKAHAKRGHTLKSRANNIYTKPNIARKAHKGEKNVNSRATQIQINYRMHGPQKQQEKW